MIRHFPKNFKLQNLRKTKVTGSSGLALLMMFARDIGLDKEIERLFSHLKRRKRGYTTSAKIIAFLQMILKGGDRLNDLDVLRTDPGLLHLGRMESVPRSNTVADLARKFRLRDLHRLAEIGMRLALRALSAHRMKRLILDIDSTIIASDMQMAERAYEGTRGFNPLVGMLRGGGMNWTSFSLFRPGNAAPQSHNLSLVRKTVSYLQSHRPDLPIVLRSDSAGYNHRLMRYCDRQGVGFVIAGRDSEAVSQIIQGLTDWSPLRGSRRNEEVGESLHFIGSEKTGAVYRLIVVRRKKEQGALFPEFDYSYRFYLTNTVWNKNVVVRFYRKRGDAENVIRELKEGYGVDHILSEDFLAAAFYFQLQLLAYNLVQFFKGVHLERSWWPMRLKQLRYRLLNIAGVVVRHARTTVLRLTQQYRHFTTFQRVFHLLQIERVELRL